MQQSFKGTKVANHLQACRPGRHHHQHSSDKSWPKVALTQARSQGLPPLVLTSGRLGRLLSPACGPEQAPAGVGTRGKCCRVQPTERHHYSNCTHAGWLLHCAAFATRPHHAQPRSVPRTRVPHLPCRILLLATPSSSYMEVPHLGKGILTLFPWAVHMALPMSLSASNMAVVIDLLHPTSIPPWYHTHRSGTTGTVPVVMARHP